MGYAIELLKKRKAQIEFDLSMIKNDLKTRYANEIRKDLLPKLDNINCALANISEREQANELLPLVSDMVCYMTTCGYNKCLKCDSVERREKCSSLQTGR